MGGSLLPSEQIAWNPGLEISRGLHLWCLSYIWRALHLSWLKGRLQIDTRISTCEKSLGSPVQFKIQQGIYLTNQRSVAVNGFDRIKHFIRKRISWMLILEKSGAIIPCFLCFFLSRFLLAFSRLIHCLCLSCQTGTNSIRAKVDWPGRPDDSQTCEVKTSWNLNLNLCVPGPCPPALSALPLSALSSLSASVWPPVLSPSDLFADSSSFLPARK